MKTFKKVLNKRINEANTNKTQPAHPPEHDVIMMTCSRWLAPPNAARMGATPYVPVALGPAYSVVEAEPIQGGI